MGESNQFFLTKSLKFLKTFFTESFRFLDLNVPGTNVSFKEFFFFLIVVYFGIRLFHKYIGFSSDDENSSNSIRKDTK